MSPALSSPGSMNDTFVSGDVSAVLPHPLKSLSSASFPRSSSIFGNIAKIGEEEEKVHRNPTKFKVFGTRKVSLADRSDIHSHGRADFNSLHTIVIAVKQSNIDLLEELVNDISDPDSHNFGSVKTREAIAEITNHGEASSQVLAYLGSLWKGDDRVAINSGTFGEYISGKWILQFLVL